MKTSWQEGVSGGGNEDLWREFHERSKGIKETTEVDINGSRVFHKGFRDLGIKQELQKDLNGFQGISKEISGEFQKDFKGFQIGFRGLSKGFKGVYNVSGGFKSGLKNVFYRL